METKTIVNRQFNLQWRDWLKGFAIGAATAVGWSVYEIVQSAISTGTFADLNWSNIAQAALAGFVAYIGKNFVEKDKVVTIHGKDKKGNPPPIGTDPTKP